MCTQVDKSKTRMNFAAIKKVDPYAKDIVDTSSHVAFYIFNEERNEWEKTDVEGALFIYSRNATPFHSIFINNRLNTTAFVEPITNHLELQPQPPFLLYRNERSRIRGFWFYCSEECERLSKLAIELVRHASSPSLENNPENNAPIVHYKENNNNINIFKMLSNAQQEYNAQLAHTPAVANNVGDNHQSIQEELQEQQPQVHKPQAPQNLTSGNVMKFFAAAKPTADVTFTPRILPNTLSVEQLEKQQRNVAPGTQSIGQGEDATKNCRKKQQEVNADASAPKLSCSLLESVALDNLQQSGSNTALETKSMTPTNKESDFGFTKALQAAICSPNTMPGEQIPLNKIFSNLNLQQPTAAAAAAAELTNKPALMPPTMFDKPITVPTEGVIQNLAVNANKQQEPLNKFQFIQAFNYLIQNDDEFVQRLHDAYLKTLTKFGTYQ